ncbi:MAG: DUF488 family protein [Bacteroidota bacterium]|nr:DUF488 family protein [Bacteroidota bacterium]
MFYRRKIILALLQLFDGQLEKIRLQKLLFLFSQRQQKAEYDFIPYKYGCYSYSANADLTTMVKKGILAETESSFSTNEMTDYFKSLKESDKKSLLEIKTLYGKMNSNALMKHTYINYPFFAINSVKASTILTKKELEKVNNYKPKSNKTILFTIGYEGISLEEYLNRLVKNDVRILVDVRNNPQSMKYGFSKNQLIKYCESLGIKYMHFPEVGIQSEQRQELNTQMDYDKLFEVYKKGNLTKTKSTQTVILNLLKQYKRIALTCFEANICQCHRKHLAESIETLPGFEYETKHI